MKNSVFNFKSQTDHHPLRIADILLAAEDDEVLEDLLMKEGCQEWRRRSIDCFSVPRRILVGWISRLSRPDAKAINERKTRDIEEEERDDCSPNPTAAQATCSMDGLKEPDPVAEAVQSGGQIRRENCVNLGVGCCLLYLIAASKSELDKMMEMRMQLEAILQNAREELQHKDSLFKLPSHPNDMSSNSFALGDYGNTSSSVLAESSTITVCSQSLKCETLDQDERFQLEGMDQLEAELEAELQLLQLRLDTETLSEYAQQQRISENDEDTASSNSQGAGSGEMIDPIIELQAADKSVHCGVSPYELERRLHELLESRQEEQIRELEAALELTKQKLQKKEIEVSWWKDASRLVSQYVPESSHFTLQPGLKLISR